MSKIGNTQLALDILSGYLSVAIKLQQAIATATEEGRDITTEELSALTASNEEKRQEFISKMKE